MDGSAWRPIGEAPRDTDLLVYTREWGPIIAAYNSEFREWISRMQVPVSIKGEDELPTHWLHLPDAPESVADGARDDATGAPSRPVAG